MRTALSLALCLALTGCGAAATVANPTPRAGFYASDRFGKCGFVGIRVGQPSAATVTVTAHACVQSAIDGGLDMAPDAATPAAAPDPADAAAPSGGEADAGAAE
jgi:hypothetical protein